MISRPRPGAAAWMIGLMPLVAACTEPPPPSEPPLRPLLHTEAPPGLDRSVPGYDDWTSPDHDPVAWPTEYSTTVAAPVGDVGGPALTPEALVLEAFAAMSAGDEARFQTHIFSSDALAVASRMRPETARDTAAEIRDAAVETFQTIAPREGGRPLVLDPGQLTMGRGRDIDGALVGEEQTAVMHWGNELSFGVRGTDLEFTVRFPNLLRAEDGAWRLRSAPVVDDRFRAWKSMGLDLMTGLMDTQHAPLPLEVGNYWHYRTRRPGPPGDGSSDPAADVTSGGYRDSVVEVVEHDGYRLARLRRLYDDPGRSSERFAYLLTPTRLYACGSECIRRSSDLAWVLGYGRRETPLLVFPVEAGGGWGLGGEARTQNPTRVLPETSEVNVPAGTYSDALEIVRQTTRGRRSEYFVPGIGYVARSTRSALETELEELVDFRILP